MLLDLMRFLAFYGRSAEASPGKNLPPQLPDSSWIVGRGLVARVIAFDGVF